MRLSYLSLIILLLLIGCESTNKESTIGSNKSIEANPTESEKLSVKKYFELDSVTKMETTATLITRAINGNEVLAHLNILTNTIYFYDFEEEKLLWRAQFEREGPNSVGSIDDFFILNKDVIFVLDSKRQIISKVSRYLEDDHEVQSQRIKSSNFSLVADNQNGFYVDENYKIWLPTVPFLEQSTPRFKNGISIIRYDFKSEAIETFSLYPEEYQEVYPTYFNRPNTDFNKHGDPIQMFKASNKITFWDSNDEEFKVYKVDIPEDFSISIKNLDFSNAMEQRKLTNQNSSWSNLVFNEPEEVLHIFYRNPNLKESEKYNFEFGFWNIGIITLDSEYKKVDQKMPITRNYGLPYLISEEGLWIQDIKINEETMTFDEDYMAYLKIIR